MSHTSRTPRINTEDAGWRLQQLRLRRGLRQNELAELAGLDPGYMNRLENGKTRKAKPKPETVNKILTALNATPEEQAAVFHTEPPPLTANEIATIVDDIQATYEEHPLPVTLIDYHWVRWYHNRIMRSVLSLTDEEYRSSMGEMPVCSLIDPTSPTYHRIPDDERETAFARRSQVFKRQFAGQEFDSWYLAIVDRIKQVPWAAEIWDNPPLEATQPFLDSHDTGIYSPLLCQTLHFRNQLNRLMKDPRFVVVELTCSNDDTARLLEVLRSIPQQGAMPPLQPLE